MAEVFIPDDDHLSPFPRAPPPSPEMQQRNFSDLFAGLTPSKFETPCKFEQHSADTLELTQVSPLAVHPLDSSFGTCSTEYSLRPSASPTHPILRSQDSISHSHSPNSHSNTPSPPLPSLSELSLHFQSSPQHVEQERLCNGFSPNHRLPLPRHSQSFGGVPTPLHHSCYETQVSEPVRGMDSRPRGLSLNSDIQGDSSHRRRKISLKRKNDEVDSLQFSFEYSYSSSSGDSESWVVVDPSSYPTEKKVCQDSPVSRQRASSFGGTFVGRSMSNVGSANPPTHCLNNGAVDLRVHPTAFQPQRNSAPSTVNFQEHQTETHPRAPCGNSGPLSSLASADSEMDCGEGFGLGAVGRLDSLDSMDTEDPLVTSDLPGHHPPASPPFTQLPQIITSAPGRSHSSERPYSHFGPLSDSKFNTMEQYFSSYHGDNSFLSNNLGTEPSKFNFLFSKSL